MSAPRRALLAGATGLVGSRLLPRLLDAPRYERVTALVRRSLDTRHGKLTVAKVYFDHLDANPALLRADDVFCCLGTTLAAAGSRYAFRKVDFDYVVELARVALDEGARRFFFVSVVGADAAQRNFYLRVKGEAEDALAALGYPTLHVLRPSFLVGPRRERRPGERAAIALTRLVGPLLRGRLRRYRTIDADTVAAAMLGAAELETQGLQVHHHDELVRLAQRAPA